MSTDKIIDKIRKLLALSQSNNPNESAAAAAMAAQLMQQHNLEEAQLRVEQDAPAEPIADEVVHSAKHRVPWQGRLASGLAKSLGCHMFWLGGDVKVFGRLSDTRTVTYMFQFLTKEINRLADAAVARGDMPNPAHYGASSLRTWKNAFRFGAALAIYERLVAQRKAYVQETAANVSGCQALALVRKDSEELDSAYKAFSSNFVKGKPVYIRSVDGYHAGQRAGENVSLGGGPRLGAAPNKISARS